MTPKKFILGFVFLLAGCVSIPDGVTPVENFQLERYLGKWYEIARLDHSFERGLSRASAEYSLNADGSVKVVNSGFSVVAVMQDGVCQLLQTFLYDIPEDVSYHLISNQVPEDGQSVGEFLVGNKVVTLPNPNLGSILFDQYTNKKYKQTMTFFHFFLTTEISFSNNKRKNRSFSWFRINLNFGVEHGCMCPANG